MQSDPTPGMCLHVHVGLLMEVALQFMAVTAMVRRFGRGSPVVLKSYLL
jgi:hypothetical protein